MSDNNDQEEPKPMSTPNLNYPSNSNKSRDQKAVPEREERPKLDSVIDKPAIQRKKPLGRRIAETFTGEDAKSVGLFVLFDVIVPAAKSMILDSIQQGSERMLMGDVKGRVRPGSRPTITNYNNVSRIGSNIPTSRRELSSRARAVHDFDEIIVPTRVEAERVIDRLGDLVDNYGVAKVSDLYDLVEITGSYVDDKWGWYDLRGAKVLPVRGGYLLDLPKTEPIE